MRKLQCLEIVVLLFTLLQTWPLVGEVLVTVFHVPPKEAFSFYTINKSPYPLKNDLGARARFSIVEGRPDRNSGGLVRLNDGRVPFYEDAPEENFFFAAGTSGGKILIDLGELQDIVRITTYSWHIGSRAPQVYVLYGSALTIDDIRFSQNTPQDSHWKLLAQIDTRGNLGPIGGQYVVNITSPQGSLGKFRYLLFDIRCTNMEDPFSNTFYSEIDIVGKDDKELISVAEQEWENTLNVVEIEGGFIVIIDATMTPALASWIKEQVVGMVKSWYPKLIELLPSKNFNPPQRIYIVFDPNMRGVAATSGARIRCSAKWIMENLEGEALGAIFHELVHVIQQYKRSAPAWLVEGIADYLRWFVFEPEKKGAEISHVRAATVRYDAGYRVSANFLNWVVHHYGTNVIVRLNEELREGRYNEQIWKELTGLSLEELNTKWVNSLAGMENKD